MTLPKPLIVETESGSTWKSQLVYDQLTGREYYSKVEVSTLPLKGEIKSLPVSTCSRCGHEIKEGSECRWCKKHSIPTKISKRMLKRLNHYEYLDEISSTDMAIYRKIMDEEDVFGKEKFPEVVWEALYQKIEEIGDPCVDNLRVCNKDDKLQRLFFRIAQENGCCGEETFEYEYCGVTYLLGFNYGH